MNWNSLPFSPFQKLLQTYSRIWNRKEPLSSQSCSRRCGGRSPLQRRPVAHPHTLWQSWTALRRTVEDRCDSNSALQCQETWSQSLFITFYLLQPRCELGSLQTGPEKHKHSNKTSSLPWQGKQPGSTHVQYRWATVPMPVLGRRSHLS